MVAAAELGRNPASTHQIQPEYGDEQADAGRDGWTRLARPNSQARTGTGEYYFPCSADHEQDWRPYLPGVTQEEGHAGFLIHLPSSAVVVVLLPLLFSSRRIQAFLSLVDLEVESLCTNDLIFHHSFLSGIIIFLWGKIPLRATAPGFELTSQRQKIEVFVPT